MVSITYKKDFKERSTYNVLLAAILIVVKNFEVVAVISILTT